MEADHAYYKTIQEDERYADVPKDELVKPILGLVATRLLCTLHAIEGTAVRTPWRQQ